MRSTFLAFGAALAMAFLSGCSPDPGAHLGAMLTSNPEVSGFFQQIECSAPSSSGVSQCTVEFPEDVKLPAAQVEVASEFPRAFKFSHEHWFVGSVKVETKLEASAMDAAVAERALRSTLEKVVKATIAQGGEPLQQAATRYQNTRSYYFR